MKILVAIKQVPARDSQLKIASSGRWIEEADLAHEINEPDAYALEAGLQLRRSTAGKWWRCVSGPRAQARRFGKRWPKAPTGRYISRSKIRAPTTPWRPRG